MTHHGFATMALFLSMALSLVQPGEVGVDASKEAEASTGAAHCVAHSDSCGFCGRPVSKLVRMTTSSGEDPG